MLLIIVLLNYDKVDYKIFGSIITYDIKDCEKSK